MARPSRVELATIAQALDQLLVGTNLDKLWRPAATELLIDFRVLGARRLFIDLAQRHPRVVVTTRWPPTPASPDRETLVLRKLLEGIRVAAVEAEADRRLVFRFFARHEATLRLVVQVAGRYPNAAVFDANDVELVRLVAERPASDPDSPPLPDGSTEPLGDDSAAWLAASAEASWADADRRAFEAARDELAREIRHARTRLARRQEAFEAELASAAEADVIRHRGELLKGVFQRIAPRATEIDVEDWASPDGRMVKIVLDPALSPAENLSKIFARYRKLVRQKAEVEKRLLAAWEEDLALAALAGECEGASTLEEVAVVRTRLHARAVKPPRTQPLPARRSEGKRLPYRRFEARDQSIILVGRSARDNDLLTFQVASGRDIFLHAKDFPGSHVILRHCRGGEPSHEALIDAATLAAWTSAARGEAVVDVLWTERKHVRKVPGVPGRVTTAAARTLAVRIEQARVDRLYATLTGPADDS